MNAFLEDLAPVWTPHPGQREFLLARGRIRVLACGRRWGKTDVCAVQALFAMTRPDPTRHLVIAPTADQARILFDRTVELLEAWCRLNQIRAGPKVRRTPHPSLELGPHRLSARSGHLMHALRGHEATTVVVDEAAYLPEEAITEVAMPMLATTDGEMVLISTPNGRNHFWRFYEMGQRGEHGVWSKRAPTSQSPLVKPEFLAVQRELVSERAFAVEYEAEFADGAGQAFRSGAIEQCTVPELGPLTGPPWYVGIDWARYHDRTAVAVLCGDRDRAQLARMDVMQGVSWPVQIERIADLLGRYEGCRVLCDSTGVGDPVIEQLRTAAPRIGLEGLTFNQMVKQRLIDNLAWTLERGTLRMLPDPELLRELNHFTATPTEHGVRLSAPGGLHDDRVIALALAASMLPVRYPGAPVMTGEVRKFHQGRGPKEKR